MVTSKIKTNVGEKTWNGLYILIILSAVITWLSTKVSKIGQPKQTQQVKLADGSVVEKDVDPTATMSIILPLMMLFFTFSYTGMFALYIVVNSTMSILISLSIIYIKKFIPKKDKPKTETATTNDYTYQKYIIIDDKQTKNDTKEKNKNNKDSKKDTK